MIILRLVLALLAASIGLATFQAEPLRPTARTLELAQARGPHVSDPDFAHSDDCVACHNDLSTASGVDVSIGASWRASMMANSARDPYFLASLRRETIDHRARSKDIPDECAQCHVPAAQRIASAAGEHETVFPRVGAWRGANPSDVDRLASDGVTCTVCHQIAADGLGTPDTINGRFVLSPLLPSGNRRANGPFRPDAGRVRLMHSVTGFEQAEAPHVRESELCSSCHTLVTQALDPSGAVIGSLPEQMTYLEWRHSALRAERSCQSCHMPAVRGPIKISSVLGLDREYLARHTFLGGNAFMLNLMNRYRHELGVRASAGELEAAATATTRQLETQTASVTIERAARDGNAVVVDLSVTNVTGHKFPTGYPSRRSWLHLTITDAAGGVLFESGRVADSGLIDGNDADADAGGVEPHYTEITRADQVQIYESVMGTVRGRPTTGLLEATQYLKDNRLLPAGFDKASAGTDIRVVGSAFDDPDFAAPGDRVRYRIPVRREGALTVAVELRYQPIGYRWARNLAPDDAPEPKAFVAYFDALANTSSTLVARAVRVIAP